MNRRIVFGVLVALVLVAGAVGLGLYAYDLGVTQGLVQSGKLAELPPASGLGPYPYLYYGGPFWFHRPFGFIGCFGPLLFLLLLFVLFRGLRWGGRWHYGPGWKHTHPGQGIPTMFEEWHRRAHDQETEATPPSAS